MKAVALITEKKNTDSAQWQFDKVMSAIAYDVDLSVVFMPNAIDQLFHIKAWNSLELYGVKDIYTFTTVDSPEIQSHIPTRMIDAKQLSHMINHADIIL